MKKQDAVKYAVYFPLFLFFFYLEDKLGVRPFAVAFYMALIYCKQNVLVLSPLYIASAMIINPSIAALIMALTPCVVISSAYFIHYKLSKKIKLYMVNIYLFVSQIPQIVFETDEIYTVVNTVISLLAAQIFVYCCIIVLYAVLAKKLKMKLTAEECMAASVVLAVFGMGFYALEIEWYNAFYTVAALTAVAMLFIDKRFALYALIAFGIGGSITAGQPYVLAVAVLYGLVTLCFTQNTSYFAGASLVAADIIYRAVFGLEFTYFSAIAPAIGVIIFCLVPNKIKNKLSVFSICFKEKQGTRSLINRDRQSVAEKLETLSGVFYEISDILHIENKDKKEKADIELLTREICNRCCVNCSGEKSCREALGGGDTEGVIGNLVAAAIDNGKATIFDTPTFLSSRCRKVNGLINAANDITERYRENERRKGNLDEGREMVSEQMSGVGRILNELKREVEITLSYDTALENKLIEELNSNNIMAADAVIYGKDKKDKSLTLVVRETDIAKPEFKDTVNYVMETEMEIVSVEKLIKGLATAHFERAPVYRVVYGERSVAKKDGESGDRHNVVKISHNKVMLILSDGMGAGKEAGQNSGYAISLIESFYKAGFDYRSVMNTVGKLLSLREREEFNAVDIAVIDTSDGAIDFIKMGGRESFLVNKGAVEVIECGSLPLGIITDDAEPIVENRRMQTGGFVVMVSDGVIDVIGVSALTELLSECRTNNPDTIASAVMSELLRLSDGNAKYRDDASVLVAKIFTGAA